MGVEGGLISVLILAIAFIVWQVRRKGKWHIHLPVLVTMFSDFECPFCREAQATIQTIRTLYPDRVRIAYKAFPIGSHPHALEAARAAHCAAEQDRFWEFHDALFRSRELDPAVIYDAAKKSGVELPQFAACVTSEASKLAVQNDIHAGKMVGVSSTPSFVLNGRLIAGNAPIEDLKKVIDEELASGATTTASAPRASEQGGSR